MLTLILLCEVSGLVLIGLPSNERRKSHGSIDRIVERLLGVVIFFLASTSSICVCVMALVFDA